MAESDTFTDEKGRELLRLPGRGLPSVRRDPAFEKLPPWKQLELQGRPDLARRALEDFEERAAIMEYHGGMSREDAERAALERIREKARGGRIG